MTFHLPRFIRRAPLCLMLVTAGSQFLGCGGTNNPPLDPRWESLISARTFGTISKRDEISVVFSSDAVDAHRIGRPARGMRLEPEVEGAATFVGLRELVFTPAEDLPSGERYRVTLAAEALIGVPAGIGDYWFDFEVTNQDLAVEVDGLETRSEGRRALVLVGRVQTADFARPDAVEGVLRAEQEGPEPVGSQLVADLDDPGLALDLYVRLHQAFGWQSFRPTFATYRALPDEAPEERREARPVARGRDWVALAGTGFTAELLEGRVAGAPESTIRSIINHAKEE